MGRLLSGDVIIVFLITFFGVLFLQQSQDNDHMKTLLRSSKAIDFCGGVDNVKSIGSFIHSDEVYCLDGKYIKDVTDYKPQGTQ